MDSPTRLARITPVARQEAASAPTLVASIFLDTPIASGGNNIRCAIGVYSNNDPAHYALTIGFVND